MSVLQMSRVWALPKGVSASKRIVLLALADCGGDDGTCWPGRAEVARKCGLSERSVQRLIAELQKDPGALITTQMRYVLVDRRTGLKRYRMVFVLHLDEWGRGRRGVSTGGDRMSPPEETGYLDRGRQARRGGDRLSRSVETTGPPPPTTPPCGLNPNIRGSVLSTEPSSEPGRARERTTSDSGSVSKSRGSGSGERGAERVGGVLAGKMGTEAWGHGSVGATDNLAEYVERLLRKLAIGVPEGYEPRGRQVKAQHKQFKADVVTLARIAAAALRGKFGDNGPGWLTRQCEQLAGSPERSRMRLLVYRVKERLRKGGLSWAAM